MVAQSQQNDLQVGPQGNPESIKNRQKSRSGLQGVRLGVPSDPGSANWHQNDDPKMEPPGLRNARIQGPICIKHGPKISLYFNPLDQVWASQVPVNQSLETGGPAAGGEALGYVAPGLGLP